MKILVDADACPVKDEIIKVAKEFEIKVIMLIDTSHILYDDYAEIITVDKGKDSVDMALVNRIENKDIVVTQDYGVATIALSKRAYVINQNGLIFTNENIDSLLFEREMARKSRQTGRTCSKHKKRKKSDDERFESIFRKLCRDA
ncbi:MAG TPA: YaiI/YqxD family protein [Clostridiales bacterium]|nr:MAG: hypothetical protein A2Y22_08850 [Clostridiales bacterium GWD2_32_59]HAN10027.1 YaiI/YqxD family protein [Clostridiales bacterium]